MRTGLPYLKIIQWGITLLSILLLFNTIDWMHVPAKLQAADLRFVILAIVIATLHFVVGAWRWQQLVKLVYHTVLPLRLLVDLYIASFFVSSVIPGTITGDALRVYGTRIALGNSARASSIIVIERLLGMIVLFVLGGLAIVLLPVPLPVTFQFPGWFVLLGGVAGMAAVWLILRIKHHYVTRLRAWLRQLMNSLLELPQAVKQQPIQALIVVIATTLYQLLSALIIYQAFLTVGMDLPITVFFVVIPVVTVLLILPISVQGIGVREYLFLLLLTPFGQNKEEIIAALSLTYLFGVPFIVWGWVLFSRQTRKFLAAYDTVQ